MMSKKIVKYTQDDASSSTEGQSHLGNHPISNANLTASPWTYDKVEVTKSFSHIDQLRG